MKKGVLKNVGGGTGAVIQAVPIQTGSQKRTTGAASISCIGKRLFVADTDCNIYEGTDSANYFFLTAGTPRAVVDINSLHVDVELGYNLT